MLALFHFPLQPASRRVRLQLAEKRLDCAFHVERWWERREGFLHLNPAGEVPVLMAAEGAAVCGAAAIGEYLEETGAAAPLLGGGRRHP